MTLITAARALHQGSRIGAAALRRAVRIQVVDLYRRLLLRGTTFVAVTGSGGKTTAKELIAAVLRSRLRTLKNPFNRNRLWHISAMVLRTRPRHQACVVEVAAGESPAMFRTACRLVRPDIAVVTAIGTDHFTLFRSVEAIAHTKSELVKAVPPDGLAILNADDARVLAMAELCRGRVLTFGTSADAAVRAVDVSSGWPDRLTFTAVIGDTKVPVATQLYGAHWVPSVLSAVAVGHAMRIPPEQIAAAIARVPPQPSRMCPESTPDGITFMRDDAKASWWTVSATLDFLAQARAARKVLVLGTISDYPGTSASKYKRLATEALKVADAFVGVGLLSSFYLRARADAGDKPLVAFPTADQARDFLAGYLRAGDLVVLKGSLNADRLERIVAGWRQVAPSARPTDVRSVVRRSARRGPSLVIVGLGNPGSEWDRAPHNVGGHVLDLVAASRGLTWAHEDEALVTRFAERDRVITLMKPGSVVNRTGEFLRSWASRHGLEIDDFLIVQDDICLVPGAVRRRMQGSSGGHLGVQSIIVAFQSEGFARIKIGVGRPERGEPLSSYVIRPFGPEQWASVDAACRKAAELIVETVPSDVCRRTSVSRRRSRRTEPAQEPTGDLR